MAERRGWPEKALDPLIRAVDPAERGDRFTWGYGGSIRNTQLRASPTATRSFGRLGARAPLGPVSPVLQPRGPDQGRKLALQSRTFDLTYVISIAPERSEDFRDRRYLPRPCQLKRPLQGGHSVIHGAEHNRLSGAQASGRLSNANPTSSAGSRAGRRSTSRTPIRVGPYCYENDRRRWRQVG